MKSVLAGCAQPRHIPECSFHIGACLSKKPASEGQWSLSTGRVQWGLSADGQPEHCFTAATLEMEMLKPEMRAGCCCQKRTAITMERDLARRGAHLAVKESVGHAEVGCGRRCTGSARQGGPHQLRGSSGRSECLPHAEGSPARHAPFQVAFEWWFERHAGTRSRA